MKPAEGSAPAGAGRRGGPLSGLRVLDLSAYIAGPYGCSLLADQGAEVIKIEPPAGDNLRKYPSTLTAESRAFLGVNRSKLGVVLDLKKADGLSALLALVRGADVLVHNFRPSVAPRLGIAYEQLEMLNPRLIYCAVTGYGESGPLRDKAGYDQVLQTMTGICALQGKAGGPPEIVYGSVVDYYAAALVAAGVASALYERERSGRGQKVGVSLLRSALAMQSARMVWAEGEPRDVARDMRSGGVTGLHPAREGYIYISANTAHFWKALCERTGMPEMAANERYDTVRKRAQHQAEIVPLLRNALRSRTAPEWEALFGEAVPCAAARTIEDMMDDPQVLSQGLVADFEHVDVGRYRGFAGPIEFSRTPGAEPFAAPALGQHSAAVLDEAQGRRVPQHAPAPHSAGTAPPRLAAPPGACDAHIHVYDARFTTPEAGSPILPSATAADYRHLQRRLGLERAVVVTPAAYRTDNRVTLDAIAALGADRARGVAVLHPDVDDATLDALHAGGIRGIRFTLFNPATAVTCIDMVEPLARRIRRLDWHVQLHLLPGQIVEHHDLLERLPVTLVFDHLARVVSKEGVAGQALDVVAGLLRRGYAWVKLSGAYLGAAAPDYAQALPVARTLLELAPDRLVWGSDWPHPTESSGKPDDAALLDLLLQWAPDAEQRQRILVDNPSRLYGFP